MRRCAYAPCRSFAAAPRTLRIERRLASLVLRDLHRHVLLAALAERLLRLGDVHLQRAVCGRLCLALELPNKMTEAMRLTQVFRALSAATKMAAALAAAHCPERGPHHLGSVLAPAAQRANTGRGRARQRPRASSSGATLPQQSVAEPRRHPSSTRRVGCDKLHHHICITPFP